ncbi:MAG: Spy/CpxP family protein refolding chaperone [Azospirillaceae bacterium]|nr:Spy/CpxP family protein refolding chaperone [Azospirillaceae bacterium]
MLSHKFGPVAAIVLLCAAPAVAQVSSPSAPAPSASAATAPDDAPDGAPLDAKPGSKDFTAFAKRMCLDHYADRIGDLAALEVRLSLTDQQRPLWNEWYKVTSASAQTMRVFCETNIPNKEAPPTIVERDDMTQSFLAAHEQALKTARPALVALYQALTPEQREILDRPHRFMGPGPGPFHPGEMHHGHGGPFHEPHGFGGPGFGGPGME